MHVDSFSNFCQIVAHEVRVRDTSSHCGEPLLDLLRICFEASLQQDELRRVSFRLALCDIKKYSIDASPVAGIQAFHFHTPSTLTAYQLRKLAPSVGFSRGLIVADTCEFSGVQITGILHTGASWLRVVQGGRGSTNSTPECLIIHVLAPGSMEARWGTQVIAQLKHGTVLTEQRDIFKSRWPFESFAHIRTELAQEFQRRRAAVATERVELDPAFFGKISQQMLKRSIAVIQGLRHGGTLIIVPEAAMSTNKTLSSNLKIRHQFKVGSDTKDNSVLSRHQELMLMAADLLTTLGANISRKSAGWDEYSELSDERLNRLDEALFEEAYLLGGLTGTDGAVVINDHFEILGFGAEIDCNDVDLTHVHQGTDLDGTTFRQVDIENYGTRHRSAFRLVKKYKEAMAIVVSQDGDVRFVFNRDDKVIFFEHEAAMVVELVL